LETRVVVTVSGGPDVTIVADPDQLSQALINLVRNAAEASLSPDAAAMSKAAGDGEGNAATPYVEIGWRIADSEVLITILDSGPGLTNAGNLFVPFYTTKPGGTGIGLVLAQQIALAHSGSVRLVNRTDSHGCKACFSLPFGE
jgi:two-component system nitrogen regulation sensor histidine kinase NtrY